MPSVQLLRADIAAVRAGVLERRETAERYRSAAVAGADQIERIAQVSYDAGERGILELSGRLSDGGRPRASVRRHSTRPRGRRKSNWNSSAAGRARYDETTCARLRPHVWRWLSPWRAAADAEPAGGRHANLDVTTWTDKTELYHGISAARRRPRRAVSPSTSRDSVISSR